MSGNYSELFSGDLLSKLFPSSRADDFFDALFGDSSEGAYDISLAFGQHNPETNSLHFELRLTERPGKCLGCNLTYGLPEVFSRHPVINIKGLVQEIDKLLEGRARCGEWQLGSTVSASKKMYYIPLIVKLQ